MAEGVGDLTEISIPTEESEEGSQSLVEQRAGYTSHYRKKFLEALDI